MAGKFHVLKTSEYQYVRQSADQAKLDGGTRMQTPPTAPSVDSNVITAYNADSADIGRGHGGDDSGGLRTEDREGGEA